MSPTQTIVKLEKVNYVEKVFSQMDAMISSGEWTEGQKLPSETQLAKEFNVSRIVIREALQRLRVQKKIITRQGLGSFCSNPLNSVNTLVTANTEVTMEDYLRFLEFRSCIEYTSLAIAVMYRTDDDKLRMEDALKKMSECRASGDDTMYTEYDYCFHFALICATHNPMLIQAYSANKELILSCLLPSNAMNGSKEYSSKFHESLYQLVKEQRPTEAQQLMNDHDRYNLARLNYIFK